jgi:hypothetical protein
MPANAVGGLSSFSANRTTSFFLVSGFEALLDRMLKNIDELCAERDRLKKDQPSPSKRKVLGGGAGGRGLRSRVVRRLLSIVCE